MPKREDERWRSDEGIRYCPACKKPGRYYYNEKLGCWTCGWCERSFPDPRAQSSYRNEGMRYQDEIEEHWARIKAKDGPIRRQRRRPTTLIVISLIAILVAIAFIIPTFTSTQTPTPTLTPTPIPTLEELKEYALLLINEDRIKQGLKPVQLGTNPAAQRHAEDMLKNRFGSHWGSDGMKPYMRYTLAGGVNREGENVSFPEHYVTPEKAHRYAPIKDLKAEVERNHRGLMESPGHRQTILDKWYKKVNIGIAYDKYNFVLVQQFEGDYVKFSQVPSLEGSILRMAGQLFGFELKFEVKSVGIYYDPLPQPMTREELDATYAYGLGERIGDILPPPPPGYFYPKLEPSDVIATRWYVSPDGSFAIEANITPLLKKGRGVYTIVIWAEVGGESIDLTNFSVFVQ